jgi:hypothetical protein
MNFIVYLGERALKAPFEFLRAIFHFLEPLELLDEIQFELRASAHL